MLQTRSVFVFISMSISFYLEAS